MKISKMKQARVFLLSLVLGTLCWTNQVNAQPAGTTNFYTAIKGYNLSVLWRADKLLLLNLNRHDPFPEPLGIIGKNNQRFYIHYTSILKDAVDPYKYKVQGKSRVGNLVRSFSGTITIKQAGIYKPGNVYAPETYKGYKRGQLISQLVINEDSTAPGSGSISGKLISNFCINSKGQVFYDTLDYGEDGYGNNQFVGTWTAQRSKQSQRVQFGDLTINDSPFSDVDGITVPPEYEKYGWQSYVNAIGNDIQPATKAAIAEEKRQWWK